jgi:hypothetical protein
MVIMVATLPSLKFQKPFVRKPVKAISRLGMVAKNSFSFARNRPGKRGAGGDQNSWRDTIKRVRHNCPAFSPYGQHRCQLNICKILFRLA